MKILGSILLLINLSVFSQSQGDTTVFCDITVKDSIICNDQNRDQKNEIDDQGRKQGYWILYGKDRPSTGYPVNGIIEEGAYRNSRKCGLWTKYHRDGKTPQAKITYLNGRPNGEYVLYHTNGNCKDHGFWKVRRRVGCHEQYYVNGILQMTECFNSSGKKNGEAMYYYENGKPEMQLVYNNGVLVSTKCFYPNGEEKDCHPDYTPGEVKRVFYYEDSVKYLPDDRIDTSKSKKVVEEGTGGPFLRDGITKNGIYRDNGYNKVYHKNKEIWVDGMFRNGRLWTGKLYLYDPDGILLKIEIWKNGKYHSDAPLDF